MQLQLWQCYDINISLDDIVVIIIVSATVTLATEGE